MTDAAAVAEGLRGQADLYVALRRASGGLRGSQADTLLPAVIDALGDAPEAARLRAADGGLLRAVMRAGAGLAPVPGADAVRAALAGCDPAPVFDPDLAHARTMALPCNGERPDMPAFSDRASDAWFAAQGVGYGLGLYGEDRPVYRSAQFADAASPERRTRHLGIDVFAAPGTPVRAPLPGIVETVAFNADPLDYGHTLILRHDIRGAVFHTLCGHLAGTLPGLCRPGQAVAAGQVVAHLGDWPENGGWAAHLHLQVIADRLDQRGGNVFGVGHAGLWDVWQAVSPDPAPLLRLSPEAFRP